MWVEDETVPEVKFGGGEGWGSGGLAAGLNVEEVVRDERLEPTSGGGSPAKAVTLGLLQAAPSRF